MFTLKINDNETHQKTMAATTSETMTSVSSSQAVYFPTVEESENNRINFRDSLKFFQEQLVINGANFPSPCPSGNNTLKRKGSLSSKENSLDKSKISKENDSFKEENQSIRSCKIAIPTVDTILESVRVLRAIQKSQEERGSFWNLDVPAKSDIDSYFHHTDDELPVATRNQNSSSNQEPDKEKYNEAESMTNDQSQASDQVFNQAIAETEIKISQLNTDTETQLSNITVSTTAEETCAFWPSNSLVINSYPEAENQIKESSLSLESKNHVAVENFEIESENAETSSVTEQNIISSSVLNEKQNNSTLSDPLGQNDKDENLSEISTKNECEVANNSNPHERQSDGNSLDPLGQNENLLENSTENESNVRKKQSDTNLSHLEQNNHHEIVSSSKENEFLIKNNTSFDDSQNEIEVKGQLKHDYNNKNIASEIFTESKTEIINTVTNICDTSEFLSEICTDLDFRDFKREDTTKETHLNELNPESELLKIETYEDADAHKSDVMMNESLWKTNCSPNDRSSIKTETNDSDSGFGTQRSGSSLSPNNHSQIRKDSWSDSCSSQYASAECSPYHSLSSVFDCSSLLSTVGETKATENVDILPDLNSTTWEDNFENAQGIEKVESYNDKECNLVLEQTDNNTESHILSNKDETNSSNEFNVLDFNSDNAELDTEISYCNFIPNYTIENPCKRIDDTFLSVSSDQQTFEICDNLENNTEKTSDQESNIHEHTTEIKKDEFLSPTSVKENEQDDDTCDLSRTQKFTAASCDLISIVQSLYAIKESPAYQILPELDEPQERFEEELYILSKGTFCRFPEGNYPVSIEDSIVVIKKDSEVLCSLNMKYGEVSIVTKTVLEIDNKMGKSIYIQSDTDDLMRLKSRIEVNILKHWQTDCLQLVHYPLKCHQNVIIIDLGSCSTRAGILMDQPTLPSLFFPTICATNKTTGTNVYGMEALQSEVRHHSNLSFPVRPTIKITKHTIDIDLLEGLFKKIFNDLKVDPTEYTIQVCLPRNLSINAQTALMKLLLEDLKVKALSLTNQALLTLYAHEVSTAVVVDIGDRIDVLPVVDGFIVENGVTKLPHGGQRLIHHMKHGLAEKRISLSNEIDSFVVQYIIENLAYVAEDYEKEMQTASQYPDRIKKTVTLQPASSENLFYKTITLEEARFKIPEGLFIPDFWGLDSPGIHHLVQKAIQATSVDARKQIAENIYVSGGVTMLPGFVERLSKEMIKLSRTKIVPKVHASNYRYHCTYIGACKFAKMDVFPQVCVNLEEYSRNGATVLKKCALCF